MSFWHIEQIETARVELDLTSSDRGRCTVTAVRADGVDLFNALEAVEVAPDRTQVEVCDHCLIVGCASCGWVVLRRLGEKVLWIPAWDEMEKGEWESSMYGPPSITRARGLPLFSPRAWGQVRALRPDLPVVDALPPLDSREAARVCQRIAPAHALGDFPDAPRLRRGLLLAVMDGELDAEADAVDRCLDEHFGRRSRMESIRVDPSARVMEFVLDVRGTEDFRVAVRVRDRLCLMVEGDTALVEADA